MKTLKAMFWGSVAGLVLGRLFAPRHVDVLRAEMKESRGSTGSAATSDSTAIGQRSPAAGGRTARRQPKQVRYVGNAHTKVYHSADDGNLPSEENRVYFGSAKEAEAQGYRHAGSASATA